jgi:K+-sensing histidine kinase KdpD
MADASEQADPFAVLMRGLDHDLRTPVANILGFADLIRAADGAALTTDQALFLQRIEENCEALMARLEQLTETAKRVLEKAESGKLKAER